jgi:hypothetical protein
MYFKETKTDKSKKAVLQLIESERTSKGPRQKIIVSLGTDLKIPKKLRKQVAHCVKELLMGQLVLFDNNQVALYADQIVKRIQTEGKWQKAYDKLKAAENSQKERETAEVYIDEVQHSYSRELGSILIGHQYWNLLKFPQMLASCGFNDSQIVTAEISVLNRLISQDSEHAITDWLNTVAIDEILHVDSSKYGDDRFYRVSDLLLQNQFQIETALYEQETDLFHLEDSVFLYDLTNTYFEGQCERNPKAEYGGNQKEKRDDCPQVVVALVIDTNGFIRRHRMFNGKLKDVKSFSYILRELEAEFKDREIPTFIFDRGIVSEDNLELLKDYKYIVASRANEEMEFVEEFEYGEFETLPGRDEKKKSQIKVLLKEHDDHLYLLCKSEGRQKKERAMRNNMEKKLEEELNKLAVKVKKATDRDVTEVERKLGRLKERFSSVAKYYWFKYEPCKFEVKFPQEPLNSRLQKSLELLLKKFAEDSISYNQLQNNLESRKDKYPADYARLEIKLTEPALRWGTIDEKADQELQLEGNYLIKTNRKDLKADEIWNIYMMLTRVEKAFRDLKTNLGLRPNYHQLEDRVDGHIFISILAYHLMHTIEYVLHQQGISSSWATIKRLVSTHTYVTIQLPVTDNSTINLRKPGLVEGIHEKIYRKLGVEYRDLPISKTTVK